MILYTILISCCFLLLPNPSLVENEWKLVKEIDNLHVFTRSTATSKFKEVKIDGRIQCKMSEIVAALEDVQAQKEWVMRTIDVRMLHQESAEKFTYYITTDMPFPVKDRELICQHERKNLSEGAVHIELQTSDYQLDKDLMYIRIPLYQSRYILTPEANGWIHIDYQVKLDPGGALPAWLYNLAVTKGPLSSFKGLYDIVSTGRYRDVKIAGL